MSVDFRICPWLVQRGRTLGEDIEPRDSIFAERKLPDRSVRAGAPRVAGQPRRFGRHDEIDWTGRKT